MDYRTLFSAGAFDLHLGPTELLRAIAILVVTALLATFTAPWLNESASALIFVVGIILSGALCGLIAALINALAAFLIFNFYLAEPVLTFRITTGNDLAPLIVFNLCALIAGILSGRLNDRAQAAAQSNRRLASLLEVSHALQAAARVLEVSATLTRLARTELGMQLTIFRLIDGHLVALNGYDHSHPWYDYAASVLGSRSGVSHDEPLHGYRLVSKAGIVGVVVFEKLDRSEMSDPFMAAFVNLIALAVERALLSERIAETEAAARTEELKTVLLSSVSHDFRTPLTAISAAASSLIDFRDQLDRETSEQLLLKILDESERLNRYTSNLLEMTRIEGGFSLGRLQPLGVSEMVSAAVQRVRARASNRQIVLPNEHTDLTVNADAALFELVLINVLDNAILYSADGTEIRIDLETEESDCRIIIADEGIGIPAEDLERVFDRFYRVSRHDPQPQGTGLGLAIAKGFVEALGGKIAAATPGIEDRGTRITVTLPMLNPQQVSSP